VKRHSVEPDKNREPILKVLEEVLPIAATVLEIGSGTGQHAVFFAQRMPSVTWQPSDSDGAAVDSIAAWRREAALPNLKAPVQIDTTKEAWEVSPVPAIVAIDFAQSTTWPACVGLLSGAMRYLVPGGMLVLYGPFLRDDRPPASLETIDAELRRKNPSWGVRNLETVVAVAAGRGLMLEQVVEMASHNLLLVFRR
jgi:cyclopropane fatty-acyl-phospholipid synthase-like methyltransferase